MTNLAPRRTEQLGHAYMVAKDDAILYMLAACKEYRNYVLFEVW